MAHPADTAEASTAPANSGDAFEDFTNFLESTGDIPAQEDEEEEEQSEAQADDEVEADEAETDPSDDADEPATAIDPPVSWDAEGKELFAQLPPELQAKVAGRESEREKFVQSKATEAAEARKTAAAATESQTALHNTYAAQLEAVANAILAPEPDAYLAQTDPQAYVAQLAQRNQSVAQWQQLTAQAEQARQQVAAREQQETAAYYQAEGQRLAQMIPEASDPVVLERILTEAKDFAIAHGYAPETAMKMDATDVVMLRQASEWKSKADKYDALQKSNMEKVRAAKKLPKVVKPGVAPTQREIGSAKDQQAWNNVIGAKNNDARAAAFADFLGL